MVILDLVPRQLHDRLDFPGAMPREALIERYLRARFCVFPSHFENFPNTCLEAMCLGRCVIGTDNSGMAEMITSGVDGIIVRAADPDDLADAMIRLHGMSPEERQRMGQAAHRRMADRYHPDVIADEMERIYGGFIADHPRKSRGVAAPPTAERPGVTFILPCYNHGRFLPEALESVRQQTYPHVECIVVDDGSTDAETLAVLRDVEAAGTRVIRQANQGLAAARNAGVLASRTPFFVPLDSDDKVAPDFVEKLISPLLADPSLGYSYSHVEFFGATSGIWACGPYDPRRLLVENLSVATAVVRRAAFDLVKGYSRDMVWGFEDWDFWLALLAVGYTGRCVPEPLFLYRKHPRGQSMLDETQKHRAEMIRAMIEHHRPLFASMLAMSMSDKDAMFFRAHMEAWQLRQGGTGPADAAQAAGTLDPAIYDTLMAQAELDYIESSGSWRRIQRIRESWWYRRLAEIRFGAGWDHVPAGESPADRLRRIKASRFYRALRFAKNNRAYLWYARRKYGSDFALPFTEHR
jgi:glycosyltransferase involved in cell wall biosynthesis